MKAVSSSDAEGGRERGDGATAFFTEIAQSDTRYVAQAWAEVYSAALPLAKVRLVLGRR